MSFSVTRSRALLLAGAAATCFVANAASAAEKQFSIAPQGLSSALQAFGRQSGETILFRSEMTSTARSPGATGKLSPEAALARILSGSQFEFRRIDEGFVIVPGNASDAPPQLIKTIVQETPPPRQVEPVAPASAAVEEVVVTGSRVARSGFQAPTPVIVVGAEQLATNAPSNIADAVASLPSMRFTGAQTTANGTGNGSGLTFLNLRGLGSTRTLTLLDGRRFVPSTGTGGVDVNAFPSALVERVEVVTGGASAAYGSDAVSGVANFILNKRFEGFKADGQAGVSEYGDNKEVKASIAGGAALVDDRLHLLGSLELFTSEGVGWKGNRDWQREGWQLIPNPAATATNGLPSRLVARNARLSRESYGGLVTSGPFRGTTFDRAGQPIAFNFGTATSSSYQIGGDGPENYLSGALTAPLNRGSTFLRASYDVSEDINVYGEASYSATRNVYDNGWAYASGNTGLTIQRDNAFLPTSLRDQMIARNVSTLALGVALRSYPTTYTYGRNWTQRYAFGTDFNLGDWTGGAYYEYGRNLNKQQVPGNLIQNNFYPAVDAVFSPSLGRIICRSSLTNPSNGCVPFNVFGEDNASAEAVAYAFGKSSSVARSSENAAAAFIEGEPFSIWAGPVSVATGIEYRKEQYVQTSDPLSQTRNTVTGTIGAYRNANPQPQNGEFDVVEGYVETVVPLAKDLALARSAELNAAYRIADYSLSGRSDSWKVGLTWQVVDDLRFRFTRSRDVRAPNLSELFLGGNQGVATVRDPFRGNVTVGGLRTTTGGNPNLQPELGDTTTFGVVYSPSFLPGFTASADRYEIKITDAIGNVGGQLALDQCFAGAQVACAFINRDAAGNLISITSAPLNLSSLESSGYDFEVGYRASLADIFEPLPGDISLRAIANNVEKQSTTTPGAVPVDRAGDISASTPKWRWTAQATYNLDRWSVFAQGRYIGEGVLDVTIPRKDVDQMYDIPSVFYFDTRLTYRAGAINYYVAINNLFNKEPPVVAGTSNQADVTNKALYEVVGRMFRVGFNLTR